MAVDYFEYNTTKSFKTLKEAMAFWVGVEWVNDSAVDVGGIEKGDGEYHVRMMDTDAEAENWGQVELTDLRDKFGSRIAV